VSEIKETKAQRAERLKRELNPWEGLAEIRRFAREGFDSIPPEWKNTYFRWWGCYTQGDGAGVTGGTGGEGKALPYFMLRVRVPGGLLFSHQLRVLADLAEEYGRGVADLTVRQNIQLHWIAIEHLPDILERLWKAQLNTLGACGDVTRNVTGCPLAGADADEITDASPLVFEVTRMLAGNSAYFNLPRKYKITITGCRAWCSYPEINDVGLTATRRGSEIGYSLRVGGGLSTEPHLAPRLPVWVPRHEVPRVVLAVTDIFREADELRQSRERARLKYLFLQHGWTADSFTAEIERRLGHALPPAEPEEVPADVLRDHVGIHPQKQAGFHYVGASVPSGRVSPAKLRAAADLADRYADGQVRLTVMQNLVIPNVPLRHTEPLAREMTAAGLPVEGSQFHRGVIACTGTEFCKLALTETKGYSRWLADQLDERLPGFEQQIKIHVTGCPNSCGQHWIADIGLDGKKAKVDGRMVDAYYFSLGGAVGANQSLARRTGYRCPAAEVPDAIVRLLARFRASGRSGENVRAFLARHSEDELKAMLAGAAL
jgi:sulfite reductase (ferredoxin)